jgi:hypothetical protein
LTAFGNVTGRNAFITADGSRHAMNLFAVLVGESSKARKGTAWQHVLQTWFSSSTAACCSLMESFE